eukprot:52403-Pleurochrysis_carterae.AAC.1
MLPDMRKNASDNSEHAFAKLSMSRTRPRESYKQSDELISGAQGESWEAASKWLHMNGRRKPMEFTLRVAIFIARVAYISHASTALVVNGPCQL